MASPPIRFGRYELETRLGLGGMAEVWLARQEGPGGFSKRAVIKRILPGLAGDPEFVEMFLQEARLAALLNHPNVVQIFDLGEVEDSYYLVMEYIEGRSLRFLEQQSQELGKPLELGFVAFVLAGACAGLHHAHEQRGANGEPLALVHRDVAPDNLLVSYEGVTKVIDFGIAKAFADASRTKSGVVKGKYGYMSPEQVRGVAIDRRSDVYSMGVVSFEALGGRRPFNGSPTETLKAILESPPPGLADLRPGLSRVVVDLVHRMLAKSPAERPQNIREVGLDLAGIAQREGWGQTEVGRVVRILGGTWKEANVEPLPAPPPSPTTRAARGQPTENKARSDLADVVLSTTEPRLSEEAAEALAFPLPGAGSIDLSGRVRIEQPSPAPPPILEERALGRAATQPLELELDRTELAAAPSPLSMPPLPKIVLRSNVISILVRVVLGLSALAVAVTAARHWRARQLDADTVKLTIESRPTGCEIWLDGLPTGKYTPSVLDWDSQVSHEVLLKTDGRADTRQTVPVGQAAGVLAIDLAAVGQVQVSSEPPGAKISTASEELGTSPRSIELPVETPTKLTATLEGYLDATTTVTVSPGATVTWAPSLTPAGHLDISSDPPDAKIRVDGQVIGKTPLVVAVAAATAHLVQIEGQGLDPYKVSATVELRGTKKIVAHLADREEHRLQANLAAVNRQLDDLRRQLRALDANQSSEYFANMAGLKKRTGMEAKLDKLDKRKEDLEGQIDAHRTELEDRSSK